MAQEGDFMEHQDFSSFVRMHGDIIIFGYGDVGKALWARLHDAGVTAVFVDNSTAKQGSDAQGRCVLSLAEAQRKYPQAGYLVASVWHGQQIEEQLLAAGIASTDIERKLPREIVEREEARALHVHTTPRKRLYFETNITKHCNLNCKGCDHFAPVAEPEFLVPEEYTQDVNRLSELFHGDAERIVILGGEPLLHPEIVRFLEPTRRAFPQAPIWIATNGTLVERMPETFWEACRDNRIGILATHYPISIDYDALGKFVRAKSVDYQFVGSSEAGRTLWKFPLDLTGTQNPQESFDACRNANTCLTLEHGRLYTCSIAPNVSVFNRAFGQQLQLTEEDGIDIYKAENGQEILEAMARPMPFCRYCDVRRREYDHPWEVSKRSMEEWT